MEKMEMAENIPSKTIFDLNEYCLIELFKYLDLKSLFKLKKEHQFFHNAIKRVIANKTFRFQEFELKWCGRLMKEFGNDLKRIEIYLPAHYRYDEADPVKTEQDKCETFIELFCTNGNIKRGTFAKIEFTKEFIEDNKIFFESLHSLEIDIRSVGLDYCLSIMPLLKQAKKLKIEVESIREPDDLNEFIEEIDPNQLEVLQLHGFNVNVLFDNLPVNLTLKHLEIPNNDCDPNLQI